MKSRLINLDLLRAVAIISVLFYHAKLNIPYFSFRNGYLGVDIFFFLSGYLLTAIYKIENDNFSISNFLKKRILRIFPCYLMVCFVVLIFSFFYYLPYPYKNIALESLSSLLFISNYYYSITSFNYGAEPALLKALLHTWTLSLEIQVYLILALLYKIKDRKLLLNCFFLLGIISIYFFINRQFNLNDKTYYLTELRLWQFLFGAVIAFIPKIDLNKFISSVIFFITILLIYLLLNFQNNFSFILQSKLILILSAVIAYINMPKIGLSFLTNIFIKTIEYISRISYSLYLWHYPIFAFSRYHFEKSTDNLHLIKGFILLLIIIIPILSYHFVERPFLKNENKK